MRKYKLSFDALIDEGLTQTSGAVSKNSLLPTIFK